MADLISHCPQNSENKEGKKGEQDEGKKKSDPLLQSIILKFTAGRQRPIAKEGRGGGGKRQKKKKKRGVRIHSPLLVFYYDPHRRRVILPLLTDLPTGVVEGKKNEEERERGKGRRNGKEKKFSRFRPFPSSILSFATRARQSEDSGKHEKREEGHTNKEIRETGPANDPYFFPLTRFRRPHASVRRKSCA